MDTPNGGSNQQWIFTNVDPRNCAWIQNVGNNKYLNCDTNGCSLYGGQGSSFILTTDGKISSCLDGTLYLSDGLKLQSAVSDNSQVWTLSYAPIQFLNKVFFLTSKSTSNVLDNTKAKIAENNPVGMYALKPSSNSNQQWLFTNVQNNSCAMIENVISQMYLNCDTNGCRLSSNGTFFKATTDGKISTCDGTLHLTDDATMKSAVSDNSQIWTLNYVNTNFPPSTPLSQFNLTSPIYIASYSNSSNVLDDYYRNQNEGSRVDLYQKGSNSLNHQWTVVNVDESVYCAAFLNQFGSKNMYLKCNGNGCTLSSTPTLFAFSASQNQAYISTCDGSEYLTIANDHVKLQDYDANNANQLWLPPPSPNPSTTTTSSTTTSSTTTTTTTTTSTTTSTTSFYGYRNQNNNQYLGNGNVFSAGHWVSAGAFEFVVALISLVCFVW